MRSILYVLLIILAGCNVPSTRMATSNDQLEQRCSLVYLSAFSTADPSKGAGYAAAIAAKAKSECLVGR